MPEPVATPKRTPMPDADHATAAMPHEAAMVVMCHVVSLADGVQQDAEQDALIALMNHERVTVAHRDAAFMAMRGRDLTDPATAMDLMTQATTALANAPETHRARACAWMAHLSMLGGNTGTKHDALTRGQGFWRPSHEHITQEEKHWITWAADRLDVSDDALIDALKALPDVRRGTVAEAED